MTTSLDDLFDALLADPDELARVAVAAARPSTRHLDDDGFAAVLDADGTAADLVHLLGCSACRDRLDALHDILAVHDLAPAARPAPDWLDTGVVLFASIHARPDGDAIVETSGVARVHGALALRARRGVSGVSLRDRRHDPSLEVSVIPDARPGTFSLLVRWLADGGQRLAAQVSSAGRLRAQMQLAAGSALFSGLRREAVRVDVLDGDRRLASAWIGVGS